MLCHFERPREIRSYFTLFHVKSTDFSVASSLEMTGSCILQQAHCWRVTPEDYIVARAICPHPSAGMQFCGLIARATDCKVVGSFSYCRLPNSCCLCAAGRRGRRLLQRILCRGTGPSLPGVANRLRLPAFFPRPACRCGGRRSQGRWSRPPRRRAGCRPPRTDPPGPRE